MLNYIIKTKKFYRSFIQDLNKSQNYRQKFLYLQCKSKIIKIIINKWNTQFKKTFTSTNKKITGTILLLK